MKSAFLLLGLFSATICSAQVNYQSLSLAEATSKARLENKLILLQFESKDCGQCNEVAAKGMSDPTLATLINRTFIPVKMSVTHPDRAAAISRYNMNKTFGTLFLDAAGTLIHKMASSSTMAASYFQNIDMALNKASEGMKVSLLEKEYRDGNRSPGFIEALLLKKRTLNLETQNLLDEYVQLLPADSLASVHNLIFLAKMAPLLNSPADKALRSNNSLFNAAWYSLPQNVRIGINNRIINYSLEKAIQTKDEAYAFGTANFARSTNSGSLNAERAFERQLLRYYEGVDDNTNYLPRAIAYYNRYVMSLNPDSILAKDNALMQQRLSATNPIADTVRTGPNTRQIIRKVVHRPFGQPFATELIEGATSLYERSVDPAILTTATDWVKRAIVLFKSPEALDIYAKLLYRQKQTATAIEAQTELISLRSKRGFPTDENEALLQKMKKGEALD